MRTSSLVESWRPNGIEDLEPIAWQALRSTRNTLVIAGPGAGKTELLAQKACYLLQTRMCPRPKRILAISFKVDAATALRQRVRKRCGTKLAQRFDSYTFAAFSKTLVDRFGSSLPISIRPDIDYQLFPELGYKRHFQDIVERHIVDRNGISHGDLYAIDYEELYRDEFACKRLEAEEPFPRQGNAYERIRWELWNYLLHCRQPSMLDFNMLGLLAEALLRYNPTIRRLLQMTYSHVFLDEFQDTTAMQYDLILSAFSSRGPTLTAVGDNKQTIMGWAGALSSIFSDFVADFVADMLRLERNYRSAPRIVEILSSLSSALDENSTAPVAVRDPADGVGECRVLCYPNHYVEAQHLARKIEEWLRDDDIGPRDICILGRARINEYTEQLRIDLAARSINARMESDLQGLLAEPLVAILLDFLILTTRCRAPTSWNNLVELLVQMRGQTLDHSGARIELELSQFLRRLRRFVSLNATVNAGQAISQIMDFLDPALLCHLYPRYKQGTRLQDITEEFVGSFQQYADQNTWLHALHEFEGTNTIPIMTMHKSKGLEYHTVVYVGLEDSALWGFNQNAFQETCGFFVAFSRAIRRIIFTFCEERSTRNGINQRQRRQNIGRLYSMMENAGVRLEQIYNFEEG